MNYKKIIFSLILILIGILSVFFFWKDSILLGAILIALAIVKLRIYPEKKELICYIVSAIVGSTGESFAIFNNAWHYTQPEILNIPAWLPFLWGLLGIAGITFYKGLTED